MPLGQSVTLSTPALSTSAMTSDVVVDGLISASLILKK